MKKLTRAVILSLCLVLALSAAVVSAGASSEVPYQTYTYDKWGNATPAPNGYIPSRSIGGAQLGCGNFSSAADMFYSKALNKVFITDSGNNRIVVLSDNMELLQVLDSLTDENGELVEIGSVAFGENDGVISGKVKALTGRHAIYLRAEAGYEGWFADSMKGRELFQLEKFVFVK